MDWSTLILQLLALAGLGFSGYKFIDRKHEENREILTDMQTALAALSTDLKHIDKRLDELANDVGELQTDRVEVWKYLAGHK